MANFYILNPETQLYHKIIASIESTTGLVTTSIEQNGIENDPGYIPDEIDGLTTVEFYVTYFNVSELSLTIAQFNTINKSVSRYIERYCNNSWLGIPVPLDLQEIVCNMIRDRIQNATSQVDSRLKSESVTNYSYTLNDNYLTKSIYEKYNFDLDMFRKVSYA